MGTASRNCLPDEYVPTQVLCERVGGRVTFSLYSVASGEEYGVVCGPFASVGFCLEYRPTSRDYEPGRDLFIWRWNDQKAERLYRWDEGTQKWVRCKEGVGRA